MCLKHMCGDCTNDMNSVRCFKDHFNLIMLTELEVARVAPAVNTVKQEPG